jgi:hypothetical protein
MSCGGKLHGGVLALNPEWDARLRVAPTFPYGVSRDA